MTPRRGLAGPAAVALLLAGCSSSPPSGSGSPPATSTSGRTAASTSFSLSSGSSARLPSRAAAAAVPRYLAVLDRVFARPNAKSAAAALEAVTVNPESGNEMTLVALLQRRGWHQSGASRLARTTVVSATATQVSVDACVDVSDVDLLDRSGKSVGAAGRPRYLLEHLVLVGSGPAGWRVKYAPNDSVGSCA